MTPASHSVSSYDRIAFNQLATFSPLFTDYAQFSDRISPFFAGDYRDPAALSAQAEQTLTIQRDRQALADILLKQNERWGLNDDTRANIERLRHDDAVVVITGQQLGLFLSPLFIPYKTLTTIRLAEELSESINRPVIPVFWLHGEDHDFAETAPFTTIDSSHNLIKHQYQPPGIPTGPVGRMQFGDSIDQLIAELETSLPPTPNKQDLLDFLRTHYRPGTSLLDAFAHFIRRMFKHTGLVLFSVDDPDVKRLCAPLIRQEIQHPLTITNAVETTSLKLAKSYHTQVQTNPINLFLMDNEDRRAINLNGTAFNIKGQPVPASTEDLLHTLDEHPEKFSPNVILRPIIQDFLLPTIAYVAGPGEIAYFAQCKTAYEAAGIPMPLIYPRASITLIEPNIARVIDRYSLPLTSYNADPQLLFRRYALNQLSTDLDSVVNDTIIQIQSAMHNLRDQAAQVHPSLYATAESNKIRFEKELLRYKEKIVKAQKKNVNEHQHHFHKITTHLFPHKKLQERVLSPLHFLNLYGLDFFSSLMKDISVDTTEHQIIRL